MEANVAPVILINKFNMKPEDVVSRSLQSQTWESPATIGLCLEIYGIDEE
jgi:hypothetical protein